MIIQDHEYGKFIKTSKNCCPTCGGNLWLRYCHDENSIENLTWGSDIEKSLILTPIIDLNYDDSLTVKNKNILNICVCCLTTIGL